MRRAMRWTLFLGGVACQGVRLWRGRHEDRREFGDFIPWC